MSSKPKAQNRRADKGDRNTSLAHFQKHLLIGRRADLEKLARFTGQPIEELEQEAWAISAEIAQAQADSIDFVSPQVQDEILKRLNRRFDRIKRQSRRQTSLDQLRGGKDGEQGVSLIDFLPADELSDPLAALLQNESQESRLNSFLAVCRRTFSQFSAYLILMMHFGGERSEAAEYLAITPATLDLRIGRARARLYFQPSLFDGLVFLDLQFWPRRGQRREAVPSQDDSYSEQLILGLDLATCG